MQYMLNICRNGVGVCLLFLASVSSSGETMAPFNTDGCSLFPDRALIGKTDWCHCCIAHDFSYWRGGTSEARLKADQELKTCVLKATGNQVLANMMYTGVRTGGGPYYFTTYRWGYGWPYGRAYGELTAEEDALATSLEHDYRTKNPSLPCPSMPVHENGQQQDDSQVKYACVGKSGQPAESMP
jgi:hypothetical protein